MVLQRPSASTLPQETHAFIGHAARPTTRAAVDETYAGWRSGAGASGEKCRCPPIAPGQGDGGDWCLYGPDRWAREPGGAFGWQRLKASLLPRVAQSALSSRQHRPMTREEMLGEARAVEDRPRLGWLSTAKMSHHDPGQGTINPATPAVLLIPPVQRVYRMI